MRPPRDEIKARTKLSKRLTAEGDTIGFAVGYLLFVAGVAMVSIPAAFILAGVVLAGVCALLAIGKAKDAKRSEEAP